MNKKKIEIDYYLQASKQSAADAYSYKGKTIHALYGVHESVADNVFHYCPQYKTKNKPIAIEVGAGSGALSLRLVDMGFQVHALDYVEENYQIDNDNVTFYRADCNSDFSNTLSKQGDLITAVEIIEHLENPRHFIRQCTNLLTDDGIIILTTPNIDSSRSKADFIREGMFNMFKDVSYRTIGHITPTCTWQLYKIFEENKLEILNHITVADDKYKFNRRPRMYLLQQFISLIGIKNSYGDGAVHLFVLKKKGLAQSN